MYIYINIYIHIYTYVSLPACVLLRNRFTLTKHPTPAPTISNPPSVCSPTQAGDRHTLQTEVHPRTTKAVTAEATVKHSCSRQLHPRVLCAPRGREVQRRAPVSATGCNPTDD